MVPICEINVSLENTPAIYNTKSRIINNHFELENLLMQYLKNPIFICTDSQRTLKVPSNHIFSSKLTRDCLQNLITLEIHNNVKLLWTSGHKRITVMKEPTYWLRDNVQNRMRQNHKKIKRTSGV